MNKYARYLIAILPLFQNCSDPGNTKQDFASKDPLDEGYLGNQACISCHQEAFDLWQKSHHALAMLPANDTTVRGDFNNATLVTKGIESNFRKDNGKYIIRTEGPEGDPMDFEVKYIFGWTPLQQYLVEIPDGKGRLQAMHTAWDADSAKWFDLYPVDTFPAWDWMHWTNHAMNWNSMCADCHSTNLEKKYTASNDTYRTSWSEVNVSCEACHGPGQEHVDYVNSNQYDSLNPVPTLYTQLASGIPPIEQIEQCAPCHSRRSSITDNYDHSGRFLDHYIPNILSDNLYFGDGQILEEDYVYGSFLQSKMFQNGVKCTDCHDPHSVQLKFPLENLCINCHFKGIYDTPEHHFHEMGTESAQCINCHMIGRLYMVNDYRRDHSFRIPRPDQSVKYGTPNACNQCHDDQTVEWSSNAIDEWYGPERKPHFSDNLLAGINGSEEDLIALVVDKTQPAIVRATSIFYLRSMGTENVYQTIAKALQDSDALVRLTAINALANYPADIRLRMISPLLDDKIRSVRVTAASVLADMNLDQIPNRYHEAFQNAIVEYEAMLTRNEDFPSGEFQIGQYYDLKKEDSSAVYHYLQALSKDSLLNAPRLNLARLYNVRNQNDKAIKVLQDAILVEKDNSMAHYSLGLILAEQKRFSDAALSFENAANYDSRNTRIYYNWGLVLQNEQKYRESIEVYEKGISVDSEADDIRYAMVTALFESGSYNKALVEAQYLLEKYPQNTSIQSIIRAIQERMAI